MASSSDNRPPRKLFARIGPILLLGAAAFAIVAMVITTPPDELWPLLAKAAASGVSCSAFVLGSKLIMSSQLSWRSVLWGILRGFVVLIVALEVLIGLVERAASPAGYATSLFVIALSCASLAYWLFVSSHVRLRLPGIDEELAEAEPTGEARHKGTRHDEPSPSDEITTVEVTRLSSKAAHVAVVNDTPLPVLRAQTSVTIVREPEDGSDPAVPDAKLTTGSPFSLRARSALPVTLANRFNHVGIYRLHSAGVRVYSPFGLLSRTCGLPGRWRVRVIPNIYRISYGIPRNRVVLQTSLGLPDSPSDALDYDRVREYQPGDPLKTIHWKLVAHSQGELLTKLFETPTATTMTLTFDPYGPGTESMGAESIYRLHDALLEGAFSLIEHARENGIAGRLRFTRRDGMLVETAWVGPAMRGWFVETAHRPGNTHEDVTQSLAAVQAMRDAREGYAIFATSGLCKASVGALIACHHAGVPLVVVHALPTYGSESTRQRAFDERLRAESITVLSLTDGFQIVQEVGA